MKYIIILLLLFSCAKEEVKNQCACKTCFNMTISDSIPIQFWLNGVETFNEKVVCGLAKQECFCQPFNCDDEITIQFQDTEYDAYSLSILDSTETELTVLDFEEIATGVWQVSFTPSELSSPAICENVAFKIIAYELFDNGDFESGSGTITSSSELDWYQVGDGGVGSWSYGDYLGDGSTYVSLNTSVSASPKTIVALRHNFKQITPTARTINYNIRSGARSTSFGSWTGGSVEAVYFKNGVETATQVITASLAANTTYSGSFITSETDFDVIGIRVKWTSSGSPFVGQNEIYILDFSIQNFNEDIELAKSDCIDLKESHDCTELISYTNSTDFDDIDYESGSPAPTFYLRIPAMFHEEENPQTQEDSELSNGVIVTRRQTIQEKRLLDTGYLPNYMHKKIQKVLMHETIVIDDTQWKRRDAYEANPIKKYNLKRATVLLTKYNSIERNTI